MVLLHFRHPSQIPFAVAVFPAAIVATLFESLTHQTFHFRELWVVLALQEAMLFKMMALDKELKATTRPRPETPHRRQFIVQPNVPGR
jgi:hypothetical protein